jgi:hypothetical protein
MRKWALSSALFLLFLLTTLPDPGMSRRYFLNFDPLLLALARLCGDLSIWRF